MPRHSRGTENIAGGGACKVRKRGCPSASTSSSVLQNYRFKRVILIGKRGASTTPVPVWKMNNGSPSSAASNSESADFRPSRSIGNGMPVSARKLANALWELNKIHPPQMITDVGVRRYEKEMSARIRMLRSIQPGSLPRRLSDPSHSPDSETTNWSRTSSNRRKFPVGSQKFMCNEHNHRASHFHGNASLMETSETCSRGHTTVDYTILNKNCLKDLINSLMAAKELLKLLDRICSVKEKHPSRASLVSTLRAELDRACFQVNHLMEGHNSNRNELHYIKKRFMEEMTTWKSKEQERMMAAVHPIMEELESEKKSRKRAERLNKKLGSELAEIKTSLMKAARDLENERRSREIVEQICDELVKRIGEEKAEAEEMKRESSKAIEELEKEREMLQLADEWREERVQMKLSEAKFQFQEKNEAVDQLRNELEVFLSTKRIEEVDDPTVEDRILLANGKDSGIVVDEIRREVEDVEVDSVDSELCPIELNMDSKNKIYRWSYGNGTPEEGKSTNCNQVLRTGFSFQYLVDDSNEGKLSEDSSILDDRAKKLDRERYTSVKELRDRMLAASRISHPLGLAKPQALQDLNDEAHEGSEINEMIKEARERVKGKISSK